MEHRNKDGLALADFDERRPTRTERNKTEGEGIFGKRRKRSEPEARNAAIMDDLKTYDRGDLSRTEEATKGEALSASKDFVYSLPVIRVRYSQGIYFLNFQYINPFFLGCRFIRPTQQEQVSTSF